MSTLHSKIFRISKNAFSKLNQELEKFRYNPKQREGFILEENGAAKIKGRYMYPALQKVKATNPETLEEEQLEQSVMMTARFFLRPGKGLACSYERRRDLSVLEEIFNGLPEVACELEDFSLDVIEIYKTLQGLYGRVDLRSLRIKDYLGQEGLLTTANFKLMEPGYQEKIFKKYQDQSQAITLSLMTDEGRHTLSLTKNGTLRSSDGIPEEILEATLNMLPEFHHDPKVELVEI